MNRPILARHCVLLSTVVLTFNSLIAAPPFQDKGKKRSSPKLPYYESGKWDSKIIFTDPLAIQCAEAIRRGDETGVKNAIKAGLDVNRKGKHNCTLLLWAYGRPDTEIFESLLKAGADPNIPITSLIDDTTEGSPDFLMTGESVTSLACVSAPSNKWFNLVFRFGGDPNFASDGLGAKETVILKLCSSRVRDSVCQERVHILCKLGANPNQRPAGKASPLASAIYASKYGMAAALVDNGADIWLPVTARRDHIVPMHALAKAVVDSADLYGTGAQPSFEFPCKFVKNPNPNFQPLISKFIDKGLRRNAFNRALRDAAVAEVWQKSSATDYWDLLPTIHSFEDQQRGIRNGRPDWLRPLTEDEQDVFLRNRRENVEK